MDRDELVALDSVTAERLARIESLVEGLRNDIQDLRVRLSSMLIEIKTSTNAVQTQANVRDNYCAARAADYAHITELVKDHDKRLDELDKLIPALRMVMWVGGVLGISVLALIWSMITGQAQVIFR